MIVPYATCLLLAVYILQKLEDIDLTIIAIHFDAWQKLHIQTSLNISLWISHNKIHLTSVPRMQQGQYQGHAN
eukprot:7489263-Ditylum_brightwellii.AAC.1